MRLVQETNNLFRLTRFGMINCFLVREDDGFTLVDTGLPSSASAILAHARRLGSGVRRIALTHAHWDHAGSLHALLEDNPAIELSVGTREAPLLAGDHSLMPGESGRKLRGFMRVETRPTRNLCDGDRIGSLQSIFSPGHTPGHMAYFDVRDGSLLAGDAFTTQMGLIAAGVFIPHFPFPAWFSWNRYLAAESAAKLRNLRPSCLAVGHGRTIIAPLDLMNQAVELAFIQAGKMERNPN